MKILASDYDGTLRIEDFVSKEDKEAIHFFREKGNVFGLATGRSMQSVKKEIERNGFEFDFIIANNGGVIYDKNFCKLKCVHMNFDKAVELISYIKTLRCSSFVINDGFYRYKIIVDKHQVDPKYGDIQEFEGDYRAILERKKIAQLVISLPAGTFAKEIAQSINENFKGFVTAYVNINCIDIVPEGVSKAEGIYYIENYMGLCHDDIYTIGDSHNDVPMLEEFHGCAIAHAQSCIKQSAQYVYPSVGAYINDIMKDKIDEGLTT